MKRQLFFIILVVLPTISRAADLKYPVSEIPAELKENVDIVIREDEMRFKILAKNRATHYVHYVVTILNENGNGYASQSVGYDKLTKIIDFNGYVYDALGKQIKRLRNSEIYDQASYSGYTLYSDSRLKAADLTQATYPYTVEFEYELELKYLYSIPASYFGGERKSTQHAMYQLIYPVELKPNYQLLNITNNPRIEKLADGFESVTWNFLNLMPMKFEAYGPDHVELIPQIIAAPNKFEYEGYLGSMSSWEEYGKWQLLLNRDKNVLSLATKTKVKELTKGLTKNEDKVRVLYNYLQNTTRYVNISEGIGGLQPFSAQVVEENGYGDCKALSNYMVSLLGEAGIKGYYTKIRAGDNEPQIKKDFIAHQTNHIVVAVPNGRDTLWLECTNQSNPFGYQGTFTEDRWAIMVTENGGKLVRTINYKADQNLQSRIAQVTLTINGDASANVKTVYNGIKYETDGLDWVLNNLEKQKKWIQNNTEIPNFTINSFSMVEKKDKIPSATVKLDLTLNRYATVSGKRIFVVPNLMNRITRVPEKITDRKTDVVCGLNYLDLDTIKFTIPDNLYPEFLPEPIKITSKFGEYEANFKFDAGKVIYTRRMKVWKGRFPKETYNEFVDFYKGVSKADNTKLVFLNKT